MVLDTVYFMKKLRPVLKDFCTDFEYALPPVEYLNEIRLEIKKVIPSKYSAKSASGLYSPKYKAIYLLERGNEDYIVTIVHELIHAIQHYNLGEAFQRAYSHQLELFGYRNCPLEKQAFAADSILNYFTLDLPASLNRVIQTRLERRKVKRVKHVIYQRSEEPWYTQNNWKAIQRSHKH